MVVRVVHIIFSKLFILLLLIYSKCLPNYTWTDLVPKQNRCIRRGQTVCAEATGKGVVIGAWEGEHRKSGIRGGGILLLAIPLFVCL